MAKRFGMTLVILLAISVASSAEEPLASASAYVRRGMQRFQANLIAESLEDFDQAARLQPALSPSLWQRGISLYYAGNFLAGRQQFESHQTVNPHDVENATWHFICVARDLGLEQARDALIPIETQRDSRVPMAEVYQFYAGHGSSEAILAAARQAATEQASMYAHLYLGLYYEAAGEEDLAKHHMRLSAAAKLQDNYMHDVAKVHLLQRAW